jgi:ethanolamine utilization protein
MEAIVDNLENQELIQKVYEMVKKAVSGIAGGKADGNCAECGGARACPPEKKLKTLILTSEHGDACHPAMERLGGICALLCEYGADLDSVGSVVIYDLSLDNLFKLAAGCADNDFVKSAAKALLKGIPVFAVSEGVELLKYERSGGAYYKLLYENLDKLRKCGVTLVSEADLDSAVNAAANAAANVVANASASADNRCGKNVVLSKRVITESDVRNALASGACEMLVGPKTIITSLAAEFAVKKSILITRRTGT